MTFKLLDLVVLVGDAPEHNLRAGDLGTIVEIYDEDAVEVEFLRASGEAKAVVTLPIGDLRPAASNDVIAVRPADRKR